MSNHTKLRLLDAMEAHVLAGLAEDLVDTLGPKQITSKYFPLRLESAARLGDEYLAAIQSIRVAVLAGGVAKVDPHELAPVDEGKRGA